MNQNKIIKLFILPGLYLSLLSAFSGSGAGTEGDPYLITTLSQLQEMKNDLTAYYKLSNDIDASATSTWNDNGEGGYYGFEPIGTESTPFQGGLDGNYHVISDLYINRPLLDDVGLFGHSDWQSDFIKNLGLDNVDFTGGYRTGGLIGRSDTDISNCFVSGSVAGAKSNSVVGGLIAQSHDPVTNCYADVDVTSNSEVAGFISFNNNDVTYCYASGSVQSKTKDGGFIGNPIGHGGGEIFNCYWDTETTGQEDKKAEHVIISAFCYNPGGSQYQYIMLYNPTSSSVDLDNWDINDGNGYVNFGVTPDIPANGFFRIGVSATDSLNDLTVSLNMNNTTGTVSLRDGSDTEMDAVSYNTNAYPVYKRYAIYGGGFIYSNDYEPHNTSQVNEFDMTGKTTTQMKTLSTFTDAGWDFELESANGSNDYWDMDATETINSGYPFLSWENGAETALPIELSDFNANVIGGKVNVSWTTESETENSHFLVYRDDMIIGQVDGAGTSASRHSYSYLDDQVTPGLHVYAVSDVSYGGVEYKHGCVEVEIMADILTEDYVLEAAYPNPFNPTTTVSYTLPEASDVDLSVYNLDGDLIETLYSGYQPSGSHMLQWNAANFGSGVYIYCLKAGEFIETRKMILMK